MSTRPEAVLEAELVQQLRGHHPGARPWSLIRGPECHTVVPPLAVSCLPCSMHRPRPDPDAPTPMHIGASGSEGVLGVRYVYGDDAGGGGWRGLLGSRDCWSRPAVTRYHRDCGELKT